MIKVLYINSDDLRSEIQEHYDEDALIKFIESETEEYIGVERSDPDWEQTKAIKHSPEFYGSKTVYYEKNFQHVHLWIIL